MSTSQNPVVEAAAKLLADSYLLYIKTHNFHWNVVGPQFVALHNLFEEQYTELATAVDDIAETIRALGERAPGSYKEFSELTVIEEVAGRGDKVPAEKMIELLAADHAKVSASAAALLEVAESAGDVGAADIATQRVTTHDKAAWMLRSLLA